MTTVTATEVQNNFGKYLRVVQTSGEGNVMKNGNGVARLVSYDRSVSFLTESLTRVVKNDDNEKETRTERIKKNESAN